MTNSTLAGNSALPGGGIANVDSAPNLKNTIIVNSGARELLLVGRFVYFIRSK
jgi:hypothetical protein